MPFDLILQSSLNVEFVYLILKGVCKFSLINYTGEVYFTEEQTRKFKKMRYRVDDGGDTTILMNSVKVKGIKQWEDI